MNKPRKKKKQRRKEIINSFNSNSLKSATASMLKINDEETECLIDTGAYTSFISHEYWKKRKFSNTKLTTRKNWVTANGTPIEVAGQTQLQIEIGSKILIANFVIAKDLAHKIIIGVDILKPNGCVLDFNVNKLYCGESQSEIKS